MNRYQHYQFDPQDLEAIVSNQPGITTDRLAEQLDVSVSIARWVVHMCDTLEFYDGNRIRLKNGDGK